MTCDESEVIRNFSIHQDDWLFHNQHYVQNHSPDKSGHKIALSDHEIPFATILAAETDADLASPLINFNCGIEVSISIASMINCCGIT